MAATLILRTLGVAAALLATAAPWAVAQGTGANTSGNTTNGSANGTASNTTNGTSNGSSNATLSNGTSNSTGTNGSTPGAQEAAAQLTVRGQSGKFEVMLNGNSTFKFAMQELKELDASKMTVGTNGTNGSSNHMRQTFNSTNFTIGGASNVSLGTAVAERVDFNTSLDCGILQVQTFIITQSGAFNGVTLRRGDFKWNMNIPSWKFCGGSGTDACHTCQAGAQQQIGAFLDLTIGVSFTNASGGSSQLKAGPTDDNATFLALGEGKNLRMLRHLTLDGSVQKMPTGYPSVNITGETMAFVTFRFPKFNMSAEYDPDVTGATGSSNNSGTNGSSNNTGANGNNTSRVNNTGRNGTNGGSLFLSSARKVMWSPLLLFMTAVPLLQAERLNV